ncbi:MAG: hypothetical protein WD648_01630 [Planctomycetaceae bacterium]
MNEFWECGHEALEQGFRDEIARLEKELARASTSEEQQLISAELDNVRAEYREILGGDLIF